MDLDNLIAGLSLEQKVGQMFLLAFAGGDSEFVRPLIEQYGIGGCYISQSNAATPAEAVALSTTLQSYARIPLLLGADQEGAWGVLVPYSSTGPGNMALGAAGSPELVERMYAIFGAEMRAVGYNCLLAPAVDVNSNPANPIIGTRSFGADPARVAELASAAVRGARSGGIVCTAKHYPGHGDTASDSHRHLPRVERSRAELERIDLPPFRAAVAAGVDIVMTSHILYPALDPANPATMSPAILQTLLRDELGFGGVILSDSMNMGAIRHNYRPDEAAILAIRAGVDMIMLAEEHYDHDAERYVEKQLLIVNSVLKAVYMGHIPIATIDKAVKRILKLKVDHGLFDQEAGQEDPASVGQNAHRAVELAAAYAAVTLVRDNHNLLPLAARGKVALVNTTPAACYERIGPQATRGIGPNQSRPAYAAFTAALLAARPAIAQFAYEDLSGELPAGLHDAAVILAVSENYPLPGVDFGAQEPSAALINRLAAQHGDRLAVIALRDPYDLANFPTVGTYLCACSSRECSALAAALVVLGEDDAPGRLPVSIPGVAALGTNRWRS